MQCPDWATGADWVSADFYTASTGALDQDRPRLAS